MDGQLQDAKNQVSKRVQNAPHHGPQIVTVRARALLSTADYDALRAKRPTLVDQLLSGPAWDDDLIIVTRNTSDFDDTRASVINPWDLG